MTKAEIAKELALATIGVLDFKVIRDGETELTINEKHGKSVAEFYNAIYQNLNIDET